MKVPKRTLAFYNRLGIWVALLFISLGLSMQSLQVNLFAQATLDKEYAQAMAQQMAHSLRIKLAETQMQQKNAARHANTIDYLNNPDSSWKRTLKSLITGSEQIFILDNLSALGLQDQLGYAVQELATNTLKGKEFPLEAVQRNGEIHFYLATPIKDYSNSIQGILLIEYGATWLEQLRSGAAAKHGSISTRQVLRSDPNKGLKVFEIGKKSDSQLTVVTESINDYWFLTFIPADTRPQLATTTIVTPWVIALLGTLTVLFLLLWLQKREIDRNKFILYNYVRQLYRKGENDWPKFNIKIFHDLAKAMEHLANTRSVNLDQPQSLENHPQNSSTNREKQTIDLTQQITNTKKKKKSTDHSSKAIPQVMVEEFPHTESLVSQSIFRAYDIQGDVDQDLNPEATVQIGLALGSELQSRGEKSIIIAWDGCLSTPKIVQALQEGLLASGTSVISLGAAPIGILYYACHELETSNGIMVTSSHNSENINGFTIIINRKGLIQKQLMALYHRIQRQDFTSGQGIIENNDLSRDYIERIQSDIQLSRPLKVVLDGSNGIAGPIGLQLLKTMGLDVIPLNCNVDGNFPSHPADPSKPENLVALQEAVKEHKADIGIAFDGDGDRIGIVDEQGAVISPDRILMLLAKDIISRQPGCDVVYDVKSSRRLTQLISQSGGRPTMWKTGHSLMKEKMEELNAVLGGELSGHIFLRDRWYGFDDSLYVSARLLELLSHQFEPVSEIFSEFPNDIFTTDITIESDDERKFTIVQLLASEYSLQEGARISVIDGIRSDFADGWGLVRASNTSPTLTLRFVGESDEALDRIKGLFKEALNRHAPELTLPF